MPKLLLVEDDELNRECLARLLGKRGFEVVCAEDGERAIQLAQSTAPDLILMDINLPGLDGYQATRAIRSQEVDRTVPIVALTAHALETDKAKALQAGCTAYLTKPVNLQRLLAQIASLLEQAGA